MMGAKPSGGPSIDCKHCEAAAVSHRDRDDSTPPVTDEWYRQEAERCAECADDGCEKCRAQLPGLTRRMLEQLAAAEQRAERAVEALVKFGSHDFCCRWKQGGDYCTCGLDQAAGRKVL